MKKLSILVIATLIATGSFAQNINVQTAFNHLKKGKFKEALEQLQPALDHAQTSMQAKTWYYYAKTTLGIAQDTTGVYVNLLADPLDEATKACDKVLELETSKKTDEYTDQIREMILGTASLYYNKGKDAYDAKSYSEAAGYMMKAQEAREKSGSSDLSMLMYAATCWLLAEKWDEAEVVLTKLRDADYKDATIYIGLAKVAVAKKELTKAVQYLDEGEAKFPKDLGLLTEKANMYMVGELSELDKHAALNTLNKIIEIEPGNASVWNSLGACYAMDPATFDEAAAAYLKCIELNPKFTSAYYGYSNLYLDKANAYINEARDLPFEEQKKYDELIKKSEEVFMEVLPFVEQAHELDPSDTMVKQILKDIYVRLKMMDKAEKIQ